MWTTTTGLVARAVSALSTLLLVRFLTRADYGEVSNAAVLVQTASVFSTLGVGAYIIAYPRAGRLVAFHATFIHVLLGALAMGLVWLFRDRLGPLFEAPTLGRFIPGLVVSGMLDRLAFMAERPVVRDMGFRKLSASRTAGEVTYAAVALFTAWRGAGPMAVVFGNVARAGVRLTILLVTSDVREWARPVPLEGPILRKLTSYGSVVSLEGMANFASRRWDNLLVSRLHGPETAGQYILAYNLADLPAVQIGEQISDVLLASYAHLEPEKRTAAVLRAATLLALVIAPLSIGLGAVGPTFARALLKPEWAMVGPMLFVLAIALAARPIAGVFSAYLQVRLGPRPSTIGELVSLALVLVLIVTVGRLGPLWVCAMVAVAFTARALVYMWFVQRADGLRVTTCLGRLGPIFLACAPLVAAVWGARRALAAAGLHHPLLGLGLEIVAGMLAYAGAALVLARPAVKDFLGLLRHTLARR
jgi:PST family polysaccharide transporter